MKLVESVIFALKTFNKIMEEETDDTLHLMRHLLDDQYGKKAKRAKHLAVGTFLDRLIERPLIDISASFSMRGSKPGIISCMFLIP